MLTLTPQQFKEKYGSQGLAQFDQQKPKQGYIERTKSSFRQGVSKMGGAIKDSQRGRNPIETGLKFGAGAIETAFSPLTGAVQPAMDATIGKGINYVADKVSENKGVQKFAMSKGGQIAERATEALGNANTMFGTVLTPGATGRAASATGKVAVNATRPITKATGNTVKYGSAAARDVIPTTERIINHQVTKALDLTQGDVKNIALSTKNEVGRFMADNNLIGVNKAESTQNVKSFFQKNYDEVRSEIGKVKKNYEPTDIPRYQEILKTLKTKISETPGLQETIGEVDKLIKNKKPTLNDAQRVKELLDEHFSLYKASGDVGQGVEKIGLDNMRKELKDFIVQEVKENTGVDIDPINNNVATSKGILDAIKKRETAGLTRSNLKIGDLGIFGVGMALGGPLTGAALVFGKKLIESPAVQLRIAKYLDTLSDAKKASIKATLESGRLPEEFRQFTKKKP